MRKQERLLDLGFRFDAALIGRIFDGLLLGAQPVIVAVSAIQASRDETWQAPLWCALALLTIVVLRRALLWPVSQRLFADAYGGGLRLRRAILRHLVRMPLGAFRSIKGGKLIQAISEDVLWLENHAAYTRPEIGANAAAMCVCMIAAAIIWPLVGLTALAMMATGFAVLAFAQRMLLAGLERRASSLAATALAMQEHAEGVAVLRIFGSGGDDFARDVARLRTGAWRGVKRVTPIAILFRTTIDLSAAASILVAVIVFADSSSAGTDALRLALAALLIFSATVPARNFASLTAMLLLARLSRRNIESILRVSLLPESETTVVPRSFDLSYRQVCFTHKGKTELTLSDISFDANQGQMIALVGASGSGKTTCLQLMMRFWDPDSGNILIGGHDAAAMDNAVLAATFAPVFQETLLFDDTIGNNIRLGRQSASDAEVVEAARAAAIHHTIIKLQDGYDTRVGALGSRLSGGERQRVCIARAILRDAPIIVLDEATSSLDPENEEAIQKAVTALSAGRTLFVIAHNLRSVVAADKILLMKEGHIEAVGTHEELLQTSSTYGQLWERSTDGHGWSLSAL